MLTSPAKAANQSAHAPGTHIVVTKRSTLRLPLPSDPDFRKDMPVGTRGRVESADLRAADGFIRVRMDYIHNGQPVSLVDFINLANIAVQGATDAPVDAGSGHLVPDPVRVAFEKENKDTGLTLDAVNDWESLINDHGNNATMHFLKARAALALDFVMQQVPVYDSNKLLVLLSVNKWGRGGPRCGPWRTSSLASSSSRPTPRRSRTACTRTWRPHSWHIRRSMSLGTR